MFQERYFLSANVTFHGTFDVFQKQLSWGFLCKGLQIFMFPINFAKFLEHLFCRTSANSCFSCSIHSKLNQLTKFLISGKCLGTDFTETKIFIDCSMQLTIYEEEPQVNIHRSSKNSCFEKFCNIFNKETRSAKPFSKLLKP